MSSQIFFILLALMIARPGQSFDGGDTGDDFDRPDTYIETHGGDRWNSYGQFYGKANGSEIYAGRGRERDNTGTGVIVKNGKFDGWAEGMVKSEQRSTNSQRPTDASPCGNKQSINKFRNDQPCSNKPSNGSPDGSVDRGESGDGFKGYKDGEVKIKSHGDGNWDSYGQGNVKVAQGEEVFIGRAVSGSNSGTGIYVKNGSATGWAEGMANSKQRNRRHIISKRTVPLFNPCTICKQDNTILGQISCLLCKQDKPVIGYDDGNTKITSHGSKDNKSYAQGNVDATGDEIAIGKVKSGDGTATGVHVINGKAKGWGEGIMN